MLVKFLGGLPSFTSQGIPHPVPSVEEQHELGFGDLVRSAPPPSEECGCRGTLSVVHPSESLKTCGRFDSFLGGIVLVEGIQEDVDVVLSFAVGPVDLALSALEFALHSDQHSVAYLDVATCVVGDFFS